MCRSEKGQQIDAIQSRAVRSLQSVLRTKFCEIRACFAFSRQKSGQILCSLDLLAERERFEPSVQLSVGSPLPRTQGSQAGFAKSSVCDRQQFAHPGLQSRTSPWVLEKTRDRMPCRYSAAVFSARVVRETIAKYGQFLLFRRRFSEISLRPRLNGSANGNRTRV